MATNSVTNDCDGTTNTADADFERLRRFLATGSETGPYLAGSPPLVAVADSAASIAQLIAQDKGEEVVNEILKFHRESLTAREDAIIFALALCARDNDSKTKNAAYNKAFIEICQTPVELFKFVNYAQSISKVHAGGGWGKAQRRAVAAWYNGQSALDLAVAVTKYIQREKWSHRDVLKLAHVKPANEATGLVLQYVMRGYAETMHAHEQSQAAQEQQSQAEEVRQVVELLKAVHAVKHSTSEQEVARLVEERRLAAEIVPTRWSKSKEVWLAVLAGLGPGALTARLG